MITKRFPRSPKYPERICWGCDKYCSVDDLGCGNGADRTQHPMELLGEDWYLHGDWGLEIQGDEQAMVHIFLGGIRPLPPDNQPTGIFKQEVLMPVWVGREGLAGDAQADRRVHGGPEKALHQYAIVNYVRLASKFPDAVRLLIPGSIGENLSAPDWDETNIAIGDIFRFGDSTIQVSQPRSPCWKIDNRFGVEGMAQFIAEQRITGWYFRVLEEGAVEPGADFERIKRNETPVSIADLLSLWAEHRPDPDRLIEFSRTPGLTASWVSKLEDRAARLRQMAAQESPKLFHPRPDPNTQG